MILSEPSTDRLGECLTHALALLLRSLCQRGWISPQYPNPVSLTSEGEGIYQLDINPLGHFLIHRIGDGGFVRVVDTNEWIGPSDLEHVNQYPGIRPLLTSEGYFLASEFSTELLLSATIAQALERLICTRRALCQENAITPDELAFEVLMNRLYGSPLL